MVSKYKSFRVKDELQPLQVNKEAFAYNDRLRFKPIQKLCFWFLRKIRAYHCWQTSLKVTYPVSFNEILDAINFQINEARGLSIKQELAIYMSIDEFQKLASNPGFVGYLCQDVVSEVFYRDAHTNYPVRHLFGCKLVVLPYIEGFFVAPIFTK